jgi:LPPG:FO 2-phospho-L-lactate transferase
MILALAGGVGGAKLAQGLARRLPCKDLLIVVNTGDDFEHLGLKISPDLDTVMYWLAGINDAERGWGIEAETWNFMAALERLGGATWFNLGDKDIATHIRRSHLLAHGNTLSAVTRQLCGQLGISHQIAPMSDQSVATVINTVDGPIPFQEYFVRRQCRPIVKSMHFDGIDAAEPSPAFRAAMSGQTLKAVVICPSNPYLSIDPILSLSTVKNWLRNRTFPVIAVSPIIGGMAVKGPAAKIMNELGRSVSAIGIAQHYHGLIDALIIDGADERLSPAIDALGIRALITHTIMRTTDDQDRLAESALALASTLLENANA